METYKDLPILFFADYSSWLAWLENSHAESRGLWVKFAKKTSGLPSLTYEEAREGALRYGWIDGLKSGIDETYYALRFMPRAPKSGWSKINRGIAEKLIADGLMAPAGLAQYEAARADGRLDAAYDSQSTMEMPDDFRQALERCPAAAAFFAGLKSANRYAFLYRLQTAKKAGTRQARLEKFVKMLAAGETSHPLG